MMRYAAVLLTLGLVAAGCAPASSSDSGVAAPSSTEAVPTGAHTGGSEDVTAAQFGSQWPLTIDRAIIGCLPVNPPDTSTVDLFVNEGGTLYGLNGTALSDASGNYKDLHSIWKPGSDITALQDAARKLC